MHVQQSEANLLTSSILHGAEAFISISSAPVFKEKQQLCGLTCCPTSGGIVSIWIREVEELQRDGKKNPLSSSITKSKQLVGMKGGEEGALSPFKPQTTK